MKKNTMAGILALVGLMALAGWALQASGFQENVAQTSVTRWTIRILMGGTPFVCMLIGMFAFRRFSLTSAEHSRIRAVIDATPARLFDMYLDPKAHAAFTGAAVEVSGTPGSVFRAFDGFDRNRLCYVQGTGAASIVRALERWVQNNKITVH